MTVNVVARPGHTGEYRLTAVLLAFVRRDWAITRSYRVPLAMSLVTAVTSVGFVYFLGRLVGGKVHMAGSGISGGYFAFAIVGTTLFSIFSVSLTSFAQRIRSDMTTGTLEVLFTMPVRPALTAIGSASYQLVFSFAMNAFTVVLAVVLGMRFSAGPDGAVLGLAALAVSLAMFCGVGILFAAFVIVFKRGETVAALGTSALMLVGGVYYSIALMPHPLRDLADILPFTWALEILRGCLLSHVEMWARFGELCAAAGVVLALAAVVFSAALDRARRTGTLGQY